MGVCQKHAGGVVLAVSAVARGAELCEYHLVFLARPERRDFACEARCPARFAKDVAKAAANSECASRFSKGYLAGTG